MIRKVFIMKRIFAVTVVIAALNVVLCAAEAPHGDKFSRKPAPEKIFAELKNGNERFAVEKCSHPNATGDRRLLASEKSQGDYAVATVLGCSDSRVPLELIFDAGIMDLFVVRVPGNICQGDEIGGIEYGVHHAYTPVVVVLGHSDCGAVTAVVKGGHKLERNIPELLKPIHKVVKEVREKNPNLEEQELLALCIRENVYYEIKMLFERSAAIRKVVRSGKVMLAGGVYDLRSGKVEWLDSDRVAKILKEAEADDSRETKEFED